MDGAAGWEQALFRWVHIGLHRAWLDPICWLLSTSGLGWVQGLLMLPLLIWRSTRPLFAPMLGMLIVFGTSINLFKLWVPRERPSNLWWAHPQESVYHTSGFPSGHSTTSFAIAVLIALIYFPTSRRWVAYVALAWACAVGFSRVYRGVHWPTDVLGGALLGTLGACLTYLLMSRFGLVVRLREAAHPSPPVTT